MKDLLKLELPWVVLMSLHRDSVDMLYFGKVHTERVPVYVCVLHLVVERWTHSDE